MALWAELADVAALRITTAHHLFDHLLHVGSLVSWYIFPTVIPPAFPKGDKYLLKAVAAVLRRRLKQQSRHFSIGGNGQRALAGVSVRDIIADRILGLLSVVRLNLYGE